MKLFAEAVRSAISQPVASAITGLIVAGVVATIISTIGQTVQAETAVLAQIDAAGTRSIIISDRDGTAGLTPEAVDRISRTTGIEWVIGLGPAQDVRAAGNPGGNPAPLRVLHGTPPAQIQTNTTPQPGTAILGSAAQQTLGYQTPYGGAVAQTTGYAVVGTFTASDPLTFLNRSLLTPPANDDTAIRSIHILATTPAEVASATDAALLLLGAENPTGIAIQTSQALADIRAAVSGQLGQYSRNLISLILAAGLILTAMNTYGAINNRKRDLGRRRALGATRTNIISLITIQTTLTAATGAAIGAITTLLIHTQALNNPTNTRFTIATTILATLTATIAAIPPATIAAQRDPVQVLRVP